MLWIVWLLRINTSSLVFVPAYSRRECGDDSGWY